jgi:hypothetical protein
MKAIDGFSEGIAKAIVEGKSLGAAMKNVAKQILEDMISTISQILIKWAIMSAATGGMGGAATSGIGGLGKMLGFSGGGIVPSAADGMITPGNWDQGHLAMLHSQEMVLPAPLSQKVQNMTEGGGKTIHQHHVTYSPTVTAVDGKGVGDLLNKHGELFTAHMMKQMRRMNK